ncbi:MAG: inositol monophosphatase family protein [Gemmatimonadota bacterium]
MDSLLSTALEAAEAAARVHLQYFGEVGLDGVKEKAPSDFVSRVDLEAQEAAIAVILKRFPDHRVLAEEDTGDQDTGDQDGGRAERGWPQDGGYLWIVDPLDGTTNYLHRHPQFAASVGVGRRVQQTSAGAGHGQTVVLEAGAVVAARTGERWWARRGQGAFKNGLRIRVSSLRSVRTALLGTGFPFKEPDLLPRYLQELQRVLPASGGVRRGGSAALDLCYLAEGILDGFWEEDYLSPWDVAAGLVILREAGGMATRLDGSEIDLEDGSILAANSPEIFQELGDLVRGP